jgi:NitT/TauT family transport system substrate-binding protein
MSESPHAKPTSRIPTVRLLLALLVVAAASTAAVWLLTSAPHKESTFPLRVVFKTNANYLIYFVARDQGFLRDAGLQVQETEMDSTNLMIQALSAQQADFNPSASVPALYAAEQNAPGTFKFLYVTLMERGRTNDAIIVRQDSPLRSLADLKGKVVGSPPGATGLVLLRLIFHAVGLDVARDLQIQEMEPRVLLQALAAGNVDAVFAIEPLITLGAEKGISRILEAEPMETHVMNPIPIAGGVVTTQFARSQPDTTRRLQRAMERSIDFIREHEETSRTILAKAIGMPEGTARRLGINTYWKVSEANRHFVQQLADLLLEDGALQRPVDTTSMYLGTAP